jgi:uncharacterized protein with HEPN domain
MSLEDRDKVYLEHILTSINKIMRFLHDHSESDFYANDLLQDAVIRNLEIIGEAVSKLSDQCKSEHPEIPWRQISGMRNRLIHAYMAVNLELVWNTVITVLPEFKGQVELIYTQR